MVQVAPIKKGGKCRNGVERPFWHKYLTLNQETGARVCGKCIFPFCFHKLSSCFHFRDTNYLLWIEKDDQIIQLSNLTFLEHQTAPWHITGHKDSFHNQRPATALTRQQLHLLQRALLTNTVTSLHVHTPLRETRHWAAGPPPSRCLSCGSPSSHLLPEPIPALRWY